MLLAMTVLNERAFAEAGPAPPPARTAGRAAPAPGVPAEDPVARAIVEIVLERRGPS